MTASDYLPMYLMTNRHVVSYYGSRLTSQGIRTPAIRENRTLSTGVSKNSTCGDLVSMISEPTYTWPQVQIKGQSSCGRDAPHELVEGGTRRKQSRSHLSVY